MSTAFRVALAVAAAAGTLAIGRAASVRADNQRMSLRMSVGVGAILLAVYVTVALSV